MKDFAEECIPVFLLDKNGFARSSFGLFILPG